MYDAIHRLKIKQCLLPAVLIACLAGCREPYEPPPIIAADHYLVVEGFINSGEGPTVIRLSRTRNVADTALPLPESNARVTVEDEQQHSYRLNESGSGLYRADHLTLDNREKYRLRILTSGGKQYLSAFVPVLPVPKMDSINWKLEDNGVQLYVNTHDPSGSTRYYRWEYEETWEFHSIYNTYFKYEAPEVVERVDDQVHVCWQSDHSTHILLGSSAKLSKDVIYLAPLTFIEFGSEKMSVLYSILVRQYALTKAGFEYWQQIKKNSEQLGSIFDAQPSRIPGNIRCVNDPSERVVGYISAGTVDEQRFFVSNQELPRNWNPFRFCEIRLVPTDSFNYYYTGGYMPISPVYGSAGIIGYNSSFSICVDCTLRGTNIKPDFWP